MASEFPWDAVMAAAFGLLRLSPGDFWSMTPREIESALSVLAPARDAPLPRGALESLMQQFPDG